jgi:hypothetical protein
MSRVEDAACLLDLECHATEQQLDADPGNIQLAMRLARLRVITAMVQTFGVRSDLSRGHVSVLDEPNLDDGSSAGNELAGSGCSVVITGACASERGCPETDDVSGRRKQLSLPVDA